MHLRLDGTQFPASSTVPHHLGSTVVLILEYKNFSNFQNYLAGMQDHSPLIIPLYKSNLVTPKLRRCELHTGDGWLPLFSQVPGSQTCFPLEVMKPVSLITLQRLRKQGGA